MTILKLLFILKRLLNKINKGTYMRARWHRPSLLKLITS